MSLFRNLRKTPLNTTGEPINEELANEDSGSQDCDLKNFDKSWVPEDYHLHTFEYEKKYLAVCSMKYKVSDKYRKLKYPYTSHTLPYYSESLKLENGREASNTDIITDAMVLDAFNRIRKQVLANSRHDEEIQIIHDLYLAEKNPTVVESQKRFLKGY